MLCQDRSAAVVAKDGRPNTDASAPTSFQAVTGSNAWRPTPVTPPQNLPAFSTTRRQGSKYHVSPSGKKRKKRDARKPDRRYCKSVHWPPVAATRRHTRGQGWWMAIAGSRGCSIHRGPYLKHDKQVVCPPSIVYVMSLSSFAVCLSWHKEDNLSATAAVRLLYHDC